MKTAKKEQEFISKWNCAQSGRSMTVSEGSFSTQYTSQSIVHIFQVNNYLAIWSLISILLCHTIACNGKSAKWPLRKTQRNQRNQIRQFVAWWRNLPCHLFFSWKPTLTIQFEFLPFRAEIMEACVSEYNSTFFHVIIIVAMCKIAPTGAILFSASFILCNLSLQKEKKAMSLKTVFHFFCVCANPGWAAFDKTAYW